jgi:glutamine---fructose-6-phosphate transaminase (isomerizing)
MELRVFSDIWSKEINLSFSYAGTIYETEESTMCGIVGYVGSRSAQQVLYSSLAKLEYRGYDSSGIAIRGSGITINKDCVRVNQLEAKSISLEGSIGIGHTRWATHGHPSALNSHPHMDCTGKIAVVHNGVISNYVHLREQLSGEGHRFTSETDTEVIPHLIEKHYHGNLEEAVNKTLSLLEGSYAIAVIHEDESKIVVARRDSPLVLGVGLNENFIASDVPALLDYTNRVIFMENGDIAVLQGTDLVIRNNGVVVNRECKTIQWTARDIQKYGYEHFMLKEINEQPRIMRDHISLNGNGVWPDITNNKGILIVACGSSYHAGCIGSYILEEILNIHSSVVFASEFNYRTHFPIPDKAILITQSGETADVLLAMRRLKDMGCKCIVITNVQNSTASRMADEVVYMNAGPEISVAATKSFLTQVMIMYRLALHYQHDAMYDGLRKEMYYIPEKIQEILENREQILNCANHLATVDDVFFIGRGLNYPIAQEGALKLKEISYIHAEAIEAGELKHGTLALMESGTPVIAVTAPDQTCTAMLTSIKEVKARSAHVIGLGNKSSLELQQQSDEMITVPDTHPLLSPILNTVALQLLAYYTARRKNCPIDYPRNLAKSVTVE